MAATLNAPYYVSELERRLEPNRQTLTDKQQRLLEDLKQLRAVLSQVPKSFDSVHKVALRKAFLRSLREKVLHLQLFLGGRIGACHTVRYDENVANEQRSNRQVLFEFSARNAEFGV